MNTILRPGLGSVNPTARVHNNELAEAAVGLTEQDAKTYLRSVGFTNIRIARVNNKDLIGTCDYLLDRANLCIDHGKVITAYVG